MTAEPQPTVWVTRASHQAAAFASGLKQLGFAVIEIPTIDIRYRTEPFNDSERRILNSSELLIFTSANAVHGAKQTQLLSGLKVKTATIGHATATALAKYGYPADLVPPQNSTSERFLEYLIKERYPFNSNITIVRGGDGRQTLIDELRRRGASVNTIDVYERVLPKPDQTSLLAALNQLPCIISITSNEGLLNLLKITPNDFHPQLFHCDLVVNSQRCAELAGNLGFKKQILLPLQPGDQGQLDALEKYLKH